MRRIILAMLVVATTVSIAAPAYAGYGSRLDRGSDRGDWYEMPAAAASGAVRHPDSFTVVVKGSPSAGPECVNNPYGCAELYASWDVACSKNGRVVSRQGGKHDAGKVVGHPRLPMKNPKRCTISAAGALSYGAGGQVQVTIYFRN